MTSDPGITGLDLVSTPPALPTDLPGTDPGFDQIPLNKDNVFPLDELEAQGGYNRKLILPDDLIPTINLPYAWTAAGVPKLHRSQDSGALNVHVENAGGGGVAASGVLNPLNFTGILNHNQSIIGEFFGEPNILYGFDGTMWFPTLPPFGTIAAVILGSDNQSAYLCYCPVIPFTAGSGGYARFDRQFGEGGLDMRPRGYNANPVISLTNAVDGTIYGLSVYFDSF